MTIMRKVIIKIGTGVLTNESDGLLNGASLVKLVTAVSDLIATGELGQVIIVSSGAVGAGVSGLGLSDYPSDVPTRQACASVGQTRLMHAYENLFRNFGLSVAQLLLTADDLNDPKRSGRVQDTLLRLSQMKTIIPIINENDTVAVEELSVGDNDMLSAKMATMVKADLLILLTGVDGLMPPNGDTILDVVDDVESVMSYARKDSGKFSIGGMASKLRAVKLAVDAGVETVIANGGNPERIAAIVAGQGICTRFLAKK